MQRRLARILMAAALAVSLLPLGLPEAALAHEGRPVAGDHRFVVGFLNEPAYAREMNALSLVVTEEGKPVEGLEKTLKATVISGGGAATMPLELKARPGQPGSYAGYFIPTKEGSYIFQISGTIDGEPIDERFESGPGRFADVQGAQALQFPEKLPDGLVVANQLRLAQETAEASRILALVSSLIALASLAIAAHAVRGRRERQPAAAPSPADAGAKAA